MTERSPVCVTAATEPASVGRVAVQDFASAGRTGVVLRLGLVVGDSAAPVVPARRGRRPAGRARRARRLAHVIHSDDVGAAVLAALTRPRGVYNVGAEPVRRADRVGGYARRRSQPRGVPRPADARRGGPRLEPLTRSLRVRSSRSPAHRLGAPDDEFDPSWLEAAQPQASR